MSTERKFTKELKNKYKVREKLLAPKSDRTFNAIFLTWFFIGYTLGILINIYNISFSDCGICVSIATYIPSIDKMAVGSRYPEAMHYVWLYSIFSSPLLLILLFVYVREFNRRVMPDYGVMLFLVCGLFGVYICIIGMSFGGKGARGGFNTLYYEYLIYATFIACAASGAVVASIFHLTHHFMGVFNKVTKTRFSL